MVQPDNDFLTFASLYFLQCSLFHLISQADHKANYCGQKINRVSTQSPTVKGQDDLPLLLLMLLSSHLTETQLLPDLQLAVCVFSKGTSVYCTKHDISQHWLDIALGDTQKQLLALFFSSFFDSHCFILFTYAPLGVLFLFVFPSSPLLSSPLLSFPFLTKSSGANLFHKTPFVS